jgi:WD40 repeat protein/serine/threonine protein kinase
LFEAICHRPHADRVAFLDRACAGDEQLRADVDRLIQLDQATGLLLEPPDANRMAAALGAELGGERPGSRVGAYVLERHLGSGGMGSVWLADRADEQFEKRVALKVVRHGMASEDVLRRFALERQLLADLDHPGVTRLLDGGLTADGRPYLVMEYVDDQPIDRWCDARRTPVRERIELFRRVCETLDHAHRRGVVHRDIKPGNVLVTADGRPKLLDFGIAKILDPDRALDLTLAEHRPLTPGYASPEQVRGRSVTPASDVYCLGVMLFELLTGRRPYPCSTTSLAELERAICEREPTRPSTAIGVSLAAESLPHGEQGPTPEELCARRASDPRHLRAVLEGDLDNIVLKALRKEPELRYANAGELSADLGRFLHGLPVLARPTSWSYRAHKFVRRNRLAVGAAAGVFLALAAGLATSLVFWAREVAQREQTEAREYASRIAAAGLALRAHDAADARRQLELAPRRLRGWEWRHFQARADRSERTMLPRAGPLLSCALSPDGDLLASCGDGREVVVQDLATGRELARWSGHPAPVGSVEFSPDGAHLLVKRSRSSVAVWSLAERRVLREWSGHVGGFDCATYDPSGALVAAGGVDGTIFVWDASTGAELERLTGHSDMVNSVAFRQDGTRLVSASFDGTVRLWDLEHGGRECLLVRHGLGVARACFLPDGERFAVGNFEGLLSLWDGRSGEHLLRIEAHGKPIWRVVADPGGEWLATCSADGTVRLWDPDDGAALGILLGHAAEVRGLAVHPREPRLVSASADGTVKLWRTTTADVTTLAGDEGWFTSLSIDFDGSSLVESGQSGAALWVRDSGGSWTRRDSWPLPRIRDSSTVVAIDPEGRRVAFYLCRGPVEVVELGSATPPRPLAEEARDVQDLEFSPDGRFLCSSDRSGRVTLWRVADASRVWSAPGYGRWAVDADFSPDGGRLLWGSGDGTARVLDVRSGTELLLVEAPAGIMGVAFHPDGDRFAVACNDSRVRIFDATTGEPRAVMPGHSRGAHCVDFSPDGERLASGGLDCAVRLWDPRTGQEVAVLYGHRQRVDDVAFSADGRLLISKSIDGAIRVWDAPPPD